MVFIGLVVQAESVVFYGIPDRSKFQESIIFSKNTTEKLLLSIIRA
jgi:hypothetical protein